MSIYTGRDPLGRKGSEKTQPMREATDSSEGFNESDGSQDDAAIEKLRNLGWQATTSSDQRTRQHHEPQFADEVRPTQPLLRTKRSKRCRTCRHILVKPEPKIQSTRYKIKLIALHYIPTFSLKPLQPAPSTQQIPTDLNAIPPLRASQYLLTLKNPLFDPVKVTLATPAQTPGRHQHKVTILCPDFDIGSNVDQWDEALNSSKEKRMSKHMSLTKVEYSGGEGGKVAEAGKIWEKARNWTTVVLEVVCADVHGSSNHELEDHEELLEIPIFVRLEWEYEAQGDDGTSASGAGKRDARKEKRELAYWVVVGIGRVGKVVAAKAPSIAQSS